MTEGIEKVMVRVKQVIEGYTDVEAALEPGKYYFEEVMNWIVRPIRAVVFADEKAFQWIKKQLGLTEYQMAALVWFKGLIIGLLLGWWLL